MDMSNKALALAPHWSAFRADVVAGLSRTQKTLPCRWLYDNFGSELFEAITKLPEYYPTRTESAILRANATAIADFVGSGATLLEYGAGAGVKTETLLAALSSPQQYIPIDIAGEFLGETVARIRQRFPAILVKPVIADFMVDFELPNELASGRRAAFFPGSTIGNLDVVDAGLFLRRMRQHVGPDGVAIIGFDLRKDTDVMVAAYDDSRGVTGRFNLNMLARINRELDGDFQLRRFQHSARWNEAESAVEMHLVSLVAQTVSIGSDSFRFEAGESIHTESSRKYSVDNFTAFAGRHGWQVKRVWTDPCDLFAVVGLG